MFNKLRVATRLFRDKFGFVRGVSLWISLLKEKTSRPGSLFSVRVPGIRSRIYLRARTSDIEAFCQIFVHGELDVPIAHPVSYVIDAGANIGMASVYFANRFPGAEIDALEVDSRNVSVLRLNARDYLNINVIPKGLWGAATMLRIVNPDAEPWEYRVGETDSNDPSGFPAVSVNDLLQERKAHRIDVLKIDIEGSEKEVFESETSWLYRVGTLFVEVHDRLKRGCSDAVFAACAKRPHEKIISGEYQVITFLPLRQ